MTIFSLASEEFKKISPLFKTFQTFFTIFILVLENLANLRYLVYENCLNFLDLKSHLASNAKSWRKKLTPLPL